MINLSVGMLGSIMVLSPESLVIDNDMCGAILRSVRGCELQTDSLDLSAVERVVNGDGHFLGEAQTMQLMRSEYVYPSLGDRQSVADWLDTGAQPIDHRAHQQVQSILATTPPMHLSQNAEMKIRQAFPIHLNES